jgi:hypothetical protein
MPEPILIIEACVECDQDLEHCHGTAIVHFDGSADCTEDPGCRLIVEQHLWVIACAEVDCDCGGVLPQTVLPQTVQPQTGRGAA